MEKEWKSIKGYEGFYEISSLGRVRSIDRYVSRSDGKVCFCRGRILIPFKGNTCNYLSVQLCRDNIPQKFLIHRLVAIHFLDLDPKTNMEVNHLNGNKFDNSVINLEVVTHQQNIDHSVATMLKNDYGENSSNAKLTNKQAEEIRRQWRNGVMQKDLAEVYGVHKQTICSIVNYKTYFR